MLGTVAVDCIRHAQHSGDSNAPPIPSVFLANLGIAVKNRGHDFPGYNTNLTGPGSLKCFFSGGR